MRVACFALLIPLPLALPGGAETPVLTSIAYDANRPTNQVLLTWEAIPTKSYRVLTTTALGQPWLTLSDTPLAASNNLVRFRTTADQATRFYRVTKVDTDPPEISRLSPADGAVAVGGQSPLKVWLQDETGLDTNSLVLTVGTNPPVTLADPRLAYANGLLTYTPATNQFLGTNAQIVSASLVTADTLGHRGTNAWSFKLEVAPVLASNVVLVGASSPLTLVSTDGGTFIFRYTGDSAGLTNGQVLVSTDTNLLYKRIVLSLTDDPLSHTISLLTTQAALADCLRQGSVRFANRRLHAAEEVTIPLAGTVIDDNGALRIEVVSGQITYAPDFTVSGEFQNNRLVSFDSETSGTVALDMMLQASFQAGGNWQGTKPLTPPRRTRRLVEFVGPVPVWVDAVLEINIGYEADAEAQGSATWGFESSRSLTLGARLRNGQWSHYDSQTPTCNPFTPAWQTNGSAMVRVRLEPKLTLYLESLVGPSVDLNPYLELEGKTCLPPGDAGVDLFLYAGLSGTLAIDVRAWDRAWDNLPPWSLADRRGLIWHRLLATPVGPQPQVVPDMVWIPCGTFTMGSPDDEPARYAPEGPQTQVTISRGFWLGRFEVTQAEYLALIGNNPSFFNGVRDWPWPGTDYGTDLSRPVETVSWYEAVAYCAALTQRERAAGRLPPDYEYRLPTEAQWEFACRAGTATAFHYGPALLSGMANFLAYCEYPPCGGDPSCCFNPSAVYPYRTTSVGSYAPNAWGLYDMHGNVCEFCQDWWAGSLPGGSVTDPQGPATGSTRVQRGGSWHREGHDVRSATRFWGTPAERGPNVGFRVALVPVP